MAPLLYYPDFPKFYANLENPLLDYICSKHIHAFMNPRYPSKITSLLCGLCALIIPAWVKAATQPDAGGIMSTVRSREPAQSLKLAPSINVQPEASPELKPAAAFKVKVSAFHISGNTVFTEAELQSVVASYTGKGLTLAELEKAAAEISRFYRGKGYFVARAYLPAQQINAGVINLAIMEGELGIVRIKMKNSGRLAESTVQKIINASSKQGDVVNSNKMERGILLVNDLAGVSVSSTMTPGTTLGTSDLLVEVAQAGSFNGGISYDNFGNKYTGQNRIGASLNYNSPAGIGDQLGLQMMTSGSGLRYLRTGYLLPVGAQGTKIGTAYSNMSYLLGGDFSSLNAQGVATDGSLYATHPVIRSRNLNLNVQLGYDTKKMQDQAGGLTTSDKRNDSWAATLSGDFRDELGLNSYSATFASGKLDLSGNQTNQTVDAATAKTEGSYSKINYNFARVHPLSADYSLYAALSGQAASNNLDSADKWVLGGASGIRAYPQGEASGDEGQILNFELRRDLGMYSFGNIQLAGFVDAGSIVLHKNTWTGWQGGNANLPDNYNLYGAGVGLNLSSFGRGNSMGDYAAKAFFAAKIGNNPGSDINNNDSDNANNKFRFWLQAIKSF